MFKGIKYLSLVLFESNFSINYTIYIFYNNILYVYLHFIFSFYIYIF